METLNVYLKNVFVGQLHWNLKELTFSYDSDYISKHANALSLSLPLDGSFDSSAVEAFFSGLLPDEHLRKKLALYLKVSTENTFGLLKEIGAECAGAVISNIG